MILNGYSIMKPPTGGQKSEDEKMNDCCIFFAIENDDVVEIDQLIAERHRLKHVNPSACDIRGCMYDPNNEVAGRKEIYRIANELGKEKVKDHFR